MTIDKPGRPPNACHDSAGKQKVMYTTRDYARKMAREARKRYGNKLIAAYLCETGDHYHLGNNIARLRKAGIDD